MEKESPWAPKVHRWRQLMERLYADRKQSLPQEGNRTPLTMGVLLAILALLGFFLLFVSNARTDLRDYLTSRSRVEVLASNALSWRLAVIPRHWCDAAPAANTCLSRMPRMEEVKIYPNRYPDLPSLAIDDAYRPLRQDSLYWLETELTRAQLGALADFMTVALSLPGLRYYQASVFLDGRHHRDFFLNRRITAILEPQRLLQERYRVSILMTPTAEQMVLWSPPEHREPAFLATQAEWEAFEAHLAVDTAGKGAWIGILTRIVLAIFVLLLFLIIDGSPESLGLALAMGLDATALVMKNHWIPLPLFDGRWDLVFSEFFRQLAVIFHLYFICQLTRVAGKRITPWFIIGSIIAAILAFCRYQEAVNVVHRESPLWAYYSLVMNLIPTLLSALGFSMVLHRRLPWRSLALGLALAASLLKLSANLIAISTLDGRSEFLAFIVNVLIPNSSIFFALSAFFNISTLEQRVRNQSRALAEAKELEKELEIGRKVQESLLRIPQLPSAIAFTYLYRPQSFVSGDTFYLAVNEAQHRLSVVLTDITGHGIQAALKASACHTIAMMVWHEDEDNHDQTPAKTDSPYDIRLFYERVSRYLGLVSNDIPTITAFELDYSSGKLTCFRANYLNPLLIYRQDSAARHGSNVVYASDTGLRSAAKSQHDHWVVRSLAIANENFDAQNIPKGAFILLVSDGIIHSSSSAMHLIRSLRASLARESELVDVHRLKSLLLDLPTFAQSANRDDQTFLLFQWMPRQAANEGPTSHFGLAPRAS